MYTWNFNKNLVKTVFTWVICPWRGIAVKPKFLSMNDNRCVLAHVEQKIINELPASSFNRYTKYTSLNLLGKNIYDCCNWSTVWYFPDTSTLTGSLREARWSFWTFLVIVAEYRYVVRSLGMTLSILSTSSSKSMLRMRSASSMTRNLTVLSVKPFVFSRWSTRRPGVAIMMCGFLARAIDCVTMSMPPTMTAHLTPIPEPSASNCSPIW